MALWRDPLDELIDELDRALPSEAGKGRYVLLPTLEDLQAVLTPILFASKAEQERIFADPQYQRLYATVMRQLTRQTDDQPIAPPTPSDLISDPDP
jgi:hypothetical protein